MFSRYSIIMRYFIRQFFIIFLFVCFPFWLNAAESEPSKVPMKEAYQDFKVSIGVSLDSSEITRTETAYIIQTNFESITSKTELRADKILNIRPSRTVPFTALDGKTYNMPFKINDTPIVNALAKAKDMRVLLRIHPLIWHEHFPSWFFYKEFDTSKGLVDQSTMNARIEWYITSFIETVRKWEKVNARTIQVVGAFHVASEIYTENGKLREKEGSLGVPFIQIIVMFFMRIKLYVLWQKTQKNCLQRFKFAYYKKEAVLASRTNKKAAAKSMRLL